MKIEQPKVYSHLQRKRWLNLIRTWSTHKCRAKAVNSLKKRYGEDYFSNLGLRSAKKQKLTAREKLVKRKNRSFRFHNNPTQNIFFSKC